jgi:flagellar biosynthesis protein FliR
MRRAFEHRLEKPIPFRAFLVRQGQYLLSATLLVIFGLGLGVVGYHQFEYMSWLDAFLNAAMILGGMGPVDVLHTEAGKIFAGLYALFSGLVFLVASGLFFSPIVHRLLHIFHFDKNSAGETQDE